MKYQFKILLLRLLLVFTFYCISRLLFLASNLTFFNTLSFVQTVKIFFYSLRFDAASIAITNSLFILLSLIPVTVFYSNRYQYALKLVFLISNLPCIFFNVLDIGYYRFQLKRTTADFFTFVTVGDDLKNTLPKILADFWYLLLLFFVLSLLFVRLYNKIKISQPDKNNVYKWFHWVCIPVGLGIIIIAARGGLQFKPISILSAAKYTSTQNISLVLNTPFTIIKTLGKEEFTPVTYFSDDAAKKIYSPIHHFKSDSAFRNLNVVLLIMESYSKEYIGYFNNGKGHTPFLDSLIGQSLVCTNAFANGKRSIEGIPAILSGIPAMMNTAYITSTYNGNTINSLPLLLRNKNYTTAFYHGGNNGTMGFDSYTKMAGYGKYVGRNEYPGTEYDGDWGIYDEPFMQFFCNDVSKMKQPFHVTFFSLSSHHPYSVPKQYKNVFKEGTIPIHKTVSYSDYSLKQFFITAQKKDWYKNTLFVITADHTGPSDNIQYQTKTGVYSIPIIFYMPSQNLKGIYSYTTQQADIVPSVLQYMNFNEPFKFYGNSIFDSLSPHFAINYIDGIHQYIEGNTVIHFDGEKTLGCFTLKDTQALSSKSVTSPDCVETEKKLKAFIQDYNNSMISNRLTNTEN